MSSNAPQFHNSDTVVINYEGEIFPGKVLSCKGNKYNIVCYEKSHVGLGWKLNKGDKAWYSPSDILRVIDPPFEIKECLSGTRVKSTKLAFDDSELNRKWGH